MLGRRGQGKEGALWLPHSLKLHVPAPGSSWSLGEQPELLAALDGCGCGQVLPLLFGVQDSTQPCAFAVTALGSHHQSSGVLVSSVLVNNREISPRSAFLGSPQSPTLPPPGRQS